MKQVKFKGNVNGKTIKGSWYCANRPNNAKKVAERLVQNKIDSFMFVVKDIKEGKPIKCEVE